MSHWGLRVPCYLPNNPTAPGERAAICRCRLGRQASKPVVPHFQPLLSRHLCLTSDEVTSRMEPFRSSTVTGGLSPDAQGPGIQSPPHADQPSHCPSLQAPLHTQAPGRLCFCVPHPLPKLFPVPHHLESCSTQFHSRPPEGKSI